MIEKPAVEVTKPSTRARRKASAAHVPTRRACTIDSRSAQHTALANEGEAAAPRVETPKFMKGGMTVQMSPLEAKAAARAEARWKAAAEEKARSKEENAEKQRIEVEAAGKPASADEELSPFSQRREMKQAEAAAREQNRKERKESQAKIDAMMSSAGSPRFLQARRMKNQRDGKMNHKRIDHNEAAGEGDDLEAARATGSAHAEKERSPEGQRETLLEDSTIKEEVYAQLKVKNQKSKEDKVKEAANKVEREQAKRKKNAAMAAELRRNKRERELRVLEREIQEDNELWVTLEAMQEIRLKDVPTLTPEVLSCDGAENRAERFKTLVRRWHPDRWHQRSIHPPDQEGVIALVHETFQKLQEFKYLL